VTDTAVPDWTVVLRELRELAGRPGVRVIAEHARRAGAPVSLSKATVSNLLNGRTAPRRATVESFVLGCLHHARTHRPPVALPDGQDDWAHWMRRYHRALRDEAPAAEEEPPRQAPAPSQLLDAGHEIVPYRERREQVLLAGWRDDSSIRSSVLLLHGPGGAGKTRLASRFAEDSVVRGWRVIQAQDRGRDIGLPARTSRTDKFLVVVDYAERWVPGTLVRALADLSTSGSLRVLLLARSEDVWSVLEPELMRSADHLAEPVRLGRFTDSADDLASAFHTAVLAFQQAMRFPEEQLPLPARAQDAGRAPLDLHIAALVAVWAHRGGRPAPKENYALYLLSHERKYWLSGLDGDHRTGLATARLDRFARVVFVATLFGPFFRAADAREVLRAARVADSEAGLELLLDWHARLYPPTAPPAFLVPMRPDRFAEDFLADHLGRPGVAELLIELLMSTPATEDADDDGYMRRRAVAVLTGAAERYPAVDRLLHQVHELSPELFAYLNSKGTRYYLHRTEVTLRGGLPQTIYFFARVPRYAKGDPVRLPSTREVRENPRNGFLTIAKKESHAEGLRS
jgi:hypothetical protein